MKLILSILSVVLFFPLSLHAEPSRRVICRGGNIPVHNVMMREAVKAKLTEQGIAYKRVAVSFYNIRRPKDVLENTLGSGLVLGDGTTPLVSFAGTFPAPVACEMTAKVRIMVVYENAKTITNSDVTIPGTFLWRKPVRFGTPEDLD